MTEIACARIDYEGQPPNLITTQGVTVEDNGNSLKTTGKFGDLVLFHDGEKYRLLKLPHGETTMDVQAINGWNFDFRTGKFTFHRNGSESDEASVAFDCHEPRILEAVKHGESPCKCYQRIYWAKLKLLGIDMVNPDLRRPSEYGEVLAGIDDVLHRSTSYDDMVGRMREVHGCFEEALVTGPSKPFTGMLRARDEQTQVLTQQVVDILRAGYTNSCSEGDGVDPSKMYRTSNELMEKRR